MSESCVTARLYRAIGPQGIGAKVTCTSISNRRVRAPKAVGPGAQRFSMLDHRGQTCRGQLIRIPFPYRTVQFFCAQA